MNFDTRRLVLPLDCNDKVKATQRKVMERVDWLNSLRLVYNRAASDPSLHSSSQAITVEAFLNTLLESVGSLQLQRPEDYCRRSAVACFTFEEVFATFEQDFGRTISWDFVLEKVISLQAGQSLEDSTGPHSIDVNGNAYPELVVIARKSSASPEQRTQGEESPRHITGLRIPSTPHSPHTSREFSNVQDYLLLETGPGSEETEDTAAPALSTYSRFPKTQALTISQRNVLNLGYVQLERGVLTGKLGSWRGAAALRCLILCGCGLEAVPDNLPGSLSVLNLAENHIQVIEKIGELSDLHLLNLSHNRLKSIGGLYRLKELFELYLAGNLLARVSKLFQLPNLSLLDLSHNHIASMEGIIELTHNRHLTVLRLRGNPLVSHLPSVLSILPQVRFLDPPHFLAHSAYRLLGEEAFGREMLRATPAESTIVEVQLSPAAQKCAKRLGHSGKKSVRASLELSGGGSQSQRSSTMRLF